jgi:hypothetical protein
LVEKTPDRGKENWVSLDWVDPNGLRELVRRRLVFNGLSAAAGFQEIWLQVVGSHVHGEESSQFLIDRCLMRSRVLLDLIHTCKGFALNRNHQKIEEEDIINGVGIVSQALMREISLEIRDVFAAVGDATYILVGLGDTIAEDELIRRFKENGVPEEHCGKLRNLFLWYGVLGLKGREEREIYIYDEKINYDIKMLISTGRALFGDRTVYTVNPAFRSALAVV